MNLTRTGWNDFVEWVGKDAFDYAKSQGYDLDDCESEKTDMLELAHDWRRSKEMRGGAVYDDCLNRWAASLTAGEILQYTKQ